MGGRKRKTNSTDKTTTTKKTRLSKKAKKEDEFEDIIKASLPVLSDEKLISNFDDNIVKTSEDNKVEDKILRVVLPKIKIRCEPLNVEQIIDLENNENITNVLKKIKKPKKKSENTESVKKKSLKCGKKTIKRLNEMNKNFSKLLPAKNLSLEKTLREDKKDQPSDNLVSSVKNSENKNCLRKEKIKILINGSQVTFENESLPHNSSFIHEKNFEQNFQTYTQSFENYSSRNLNVNTLNVKETSFSSSYGLDDESALIELNDINLEDLAPYLENISDEELKMKSGEGINEKTKNIGDVNSSNYSFDPTNFTNFKDKNQSDDNHGNLELRSLGKNNLQTAVEAFMRNPQLNYLKENTALKKGLCFTWLSNNYMCSSEQCLYSHNALNLFTKKLKQYPSKFIMTVVVSMRNDILFVDVIMAAFKILSERKIPIIWVTFLIFFVFYVTEPSDSRFLKFWVNAARFFCQLNKSYAAANGFASLLSIFSHGEKSEEWKIIEFIKLIKQPPVQIFTTYALLQPVLKMNIPSQLLTEAIESSITTKEDLLKVYSSIIPKISFMTSPIQTVELLMKFCKTLEDDDLKIFADDLKRRLQPRVLLFKTKITHQEYPLTASFQEEISRSLKEKDSLINLASFPKEKSETDLAIVGLDNNYFELHQDFYNLMTEAIQLSSDSVPSPYRNRIKSDKVMEGTHGKEEDVCERQVTRIKQFFRDCQFDLLGKYLNELRYNVIERATEVILKLLFRMKITLQQVVDLVKIIVLPCKSENAAKIIGSVSVTLILNLVRINEWEKAYTIALLCEEKEINLVTGKVFYLNESKAITQCRIVLLLIEIYAHKNDYANSIGLIKQHSLFSPDHSLWKITWEPHDEVIRVRILEDLMRQIICSQITKVAYDLFEVIWKAQNQLFGSVDLRKYLNEILILLLNEDNEMAVNLYEKIKAEVQLKDTTARAILVTLVRQNRLSAAKSLLLSLNQNVYFLPEIRLGIVTLTVSSFWLEEELYVVFDALFDLLVTENFLTDYDNLEVNIQVQKPNKVSCLSFRPLCLGIIKPFFKDACSRIQRVLQYQFNPPLKLIMKPSSLKLDEYTLKLHLQKRKSRNSSSEIQ